MTSGDFFHLKYEIFTEKGKTNCEYTAVCQRTRVSSKLFPEQDDRNYQDLGSSSSDLL